MKQAAWHRCCFMGIMDKYTHRDGWQGFTLLEIMIVVSIIGLLATIAIPNYIRARQRSQAVQVMSDLRTLDAAVQLYVIENNKTDKSAFVIDDLIPYVKAGTRLADAAGNDILGNPFVFVPLDQVPKVSPLTYGALSTVAPRAFWSPHIQ